MNNFKYKFLRGNLILYPEVFISINIWWEALNLSWINVQTEIFLQKINLNIMEKFLIIRYFIKRLN